MSEDNKPLTTKSSSEVAENQLTDLDSSDLKKIEEFIQDGKPGLAAVTDSKIHQMVELYLGGKTYSQIASILGIKRPLITYLSQRSNWYIKKYEYLNELAQNIDPRMLQAKIVHKDFLLQLTQFFQKKIGNKISKYLQTDNEEFANEINLKEVDKYLKTLDTLEKMAAEAKSGGRSPTVGLNLGDGVTVKRKNENEIEITPKQKAFGDILKELADARREDEEKNKQRFSNRSDITEETTQNTGEEGNEKK
jgi:hypothetical protein